MTAQAEEAYRSRRTADPWLQRPAMGLQVGCRGRADEGPAPPGGP